MSFSFGSPASAPATSGLSSGFNFGANKPATPGFGLTATTQASTGLFGSTPATSAPTFGGTGTFGAGAAFGVTNTPAFGANTATPAFGTPAPAFGATSIAPAFGANATPTFGATSAAPAFGATNPPAFGATTAAPAFGAATTPAFGATTPAFGTATPAFGTTTPAFGTTTPAFGTTTSAFGTTTPAFGTTTPAFGTTTPAFGTTTPAFGAATPAFGTTGLGTGGLNFGTGTNLSTTSTGLTLGAPAATTATGLGGLGGFGFNTTTQSTGLGFFTNPTTSSAGFLGARLGTTTATGTLISTSVTPSVGLGGVAPVGVGAANTTASDGKSEPPKQMKLPNEVSTTIDTFKDFVKKQKSLSSDVMRISIKPLHKVAREAEATIRLALSLSGEVSKARAHSRRLRSAAAAALANAESVAITPGSELEGTAPPSYVKELIAELEQQLITFRRQMDVADKQMQASPKLLTEQELTLGIRRMHESLVALAGRLQAVHTQVEAQKEQYLNLRKYVLKDPTNVFDTPTANTSLDQILRDAEGTRKKTKSSHVTSSHQGSAVLSDPRAVLGSLQQLAGPTPFTYIGNNALSPYPTADTTGKGPSWQPQPQPTMNTPLNATFGSTLATDTSTFQLQKPPGKRGKQ